MRNEKVHDSEICDECGSKFIMQSTKMAHFCSESAHIKF